MLGVLLIYRNFATEDTISTRIEQTKSLITRFMRSLIAIPILA